ncbi:MAG: quinolinate synthase NadA [Anaerolineales bacterium]
MNPEVQAMYEKMRSKLEGIVPDVELRYKAELAVDIEHLKKERNAVILGHNYMEPALYHSVPDFVGDSLGLSRLAAQTDKDVIVFCGVGFMAETAKILNPDKTVLIPSEKAGCSLAESITAADVRALKERFPGVPVVTYVNTYADVKAESDYCCTSGNAVKLVQSLESDTVIFLPDEYLARNVAAETGKRVITAREIPLTGPSPLGRWAGGEGDIPPTLPSPLRGEEFGGGIIAWHGRCEVHEKYTLEDIRAIREQFPDVVILSHPECSPDVVAASDFAGSTNAMVKYVEEHPAPRYLLLTECSMGDNVAAIHRDKEFLRLCTVRCPHMNQITLENTLEALRDLKYEIHVPEEIRVRALTAVERMLAVG